MSEISSLELQYQRTEHFAPHPLTTQALGMAAITEGRALDLGCGAGRDTRALLQAGFDEVVAVDRYPVAYTYLARNLSQAALSRLAFIAGDYGDEFPQGTFAFVNAQLTLPYQPREKFHRVMHAISESLVSSGIFTGTLFGKDHPFQHPSFTFLDKLEVEALFADTTIVHLEEKREEGPEPYAGQEWHWFDVIAQK